MQAYSIGKIKKSCGNVIKTMLWVGAGSLPSKALPSQTPSTSFQQESHMNKLCIVVSHSWFGHTQRLAEQVVVGVNAISGVTAEHLVIDQEGLIPEKGWDMLENAEGIIFGCPTLMGGPSWQFKRFADATMQLCANEQWRDKLGAGFTNSSAVNGDKFQTLSYLFTFAMQHAMIWVGTGLKAANTRNAGRDDINYLGAFTGLMSQAPADSSPEDGLPDGDLRTARHFGRRYGAVLKNLY
jgi:NAD(P)H dehydrogenase (quinone)